MCTAVDPISATLTVLSTAVGMQAQRAQAEAQAQAYNQQAYNNEVNAKIAEQNARIAGRQAENTADRYAQEQQALRDKMKLIKGAQAAQFGAGGIDASVGSPLDILTGSYEAFEEDSNNLLSNQRNDVWASQMDEYNYNNQATDLRYQAQVARASAEGALKAGRIGMFSTLLSGATSFYELPKKMKVPKTPKSSWQGDAIGGGIG